ncbi:kinase-like domain-containing protein [Chlamydoabsidia padenii]|nr:kinase-like domain-containing protein [Chlamydoabsidia padenii]
MSSPTKKRIGDYQLVETIGRGVSGKVKLGVHVHTGEQVAIKIIPRQQMNQSPLVAQAVERELAVLQLLDHPHLVELRHVMQDTINVYFVMEYMDGGDLYQVLSSQVCGRLSEHQARSYFAQLIGALTWCHSNHICHRDLKLENILLDKNKNFIKIADFGMAVMQPNERLLRTSCGSPHYASPEIIKGIPYYGPATDTWSCGVILYILLTGYHPFDDKSISRLIFKIKNGHYNKRFPTDISTTAKDLIGRMLTVDPAKRIDIHDVLTHAWMASVSTQQPQPMIPNPWFEYNQLTLPMINQSSDTIEGWIWETLKILWRDMGPHRILAALSSHGPNVQKLTYRLLNKRNQRLLGTTTTTTEKRPIPIPVSSPTTDVIPDSYLSNSTTLYDKSAPSSLASCPPDNDVYIPHSLSTTKTNTIIDAWRNHSLPHHLEKHSVVPPPSPTQQSHYFRQWHPFHIDSTSNRLVQHTTKSAKVSPTLSIGSSLSPSSPLSIKTNSSFGLMSSLSSMSNDTISSSSSIASSSIASSLLLLGHTIHYCENLYHRAHSLLQDLVNKRTTTPSTVFSIGCSARNAWDAAGKLHQVLKENYSGQLCHRGYSQEQMVWTGSMQLSDYEKSHLLFVCYIPNVSSARRIRMNFSLIRGDIKTMSMAMDRLLKTLNEYERQAKMITDSNGWMTINKNKEPL